MGWTRGFRSDDYEKYGPMGCKSEFSEEHGVSIFRVDEYDK
jgi:hypothetical protein